MTARWTEQELARHQAKKMVKRTLGRAVEERTELETSTGRSHSFVVIGRPQPGGSKQAFVPLHPKTKEPYRRAGGGIVVSVVDANPKAKKWQKLVAKIAREEYAGPVFTTPLSVTFIFYRPRPDAHYAKTGLSKAGRENPFPATKPDVLKLARAAEDALTGICWADDALIVKETIEKKYGEPARMEVTVEEILVTEPQEQNQPDLFAEDDLPPWLRTGTGANAVPSFQVDADKLARAHAAGTILDTSGADTTHTDRSRTPATDAEEPGQQDSQEAKDST